MCCPPSPRHFLFRIHHGGIDGACLSIFLSFLPLYCSCFLPKRRPVSFFSTPSVLRGTPPSRLAHAQAQKYPRASIVQMAVFQTHVVCACAAKLIDSTFVSWEKILERNKRKWSLDGLWVASAFYKNYLISWMEISVRISQSNKQIILLVCSLSLVWQSDKNL